MQKFREIYPHSGPKQCVPICVVWIRGILFGLSRSLDNADVQMIGVWIIGSLLYSQWVMGIPLWLKNVTIEYALVIERVCSVEESACSKILAEDNGNHILWWGGGMIYMHLRPWSNWTANSNKKLNVNKPYMTSRKTALLS